MEPPSAVPRLLVTAHDPVDRDMLYGWCVRLGFATSVSAGTLKRALQDWRARQPAVLVAAGFRDDADTLRLARYIRDAERKRSAKRPLVLVAATGYTDQAQYEAYRSAGFDAVLTRPLREAALRSRLMAFGYAVGEDTAQAAARHKEAEAMFLRELREDVERLQEAVAGETFRDIARWSHRIKGAALMFGHECLGQMAARLEEAAGAGVSPSEMQTLLAELKTRARYLLHPQAPPERS